MLVNADNTDSSASNEGLFLGLGVEKEVAFMVEKAEVIFRHWIGKKKRVANFWKPYFEGEKMNKL